MLIDALNAQPARYHEALTRLRALARPQLDERDASWRMPLTAEAGRLDLWLARAFYEGNGSDVELANKLTRRAPIAAPNGHRFDIFQSNIACLLLAKYRPRMETATVTWCETVVTEGNHPYPGNFQCDYQFHGYNDNMPAKACLGLILGGEMLARPDWVEMGVWRLQRYAEMLSRRGLPSEYNSTTYSPFTLHALTEIAELAQSPDARALADGLARRVWLDLALHWHPRAHGAAGPHSRNYAAGWDNHFSELKMLVWLALGGEAAGLGLDDLFTPARWLRIHHCGNLLEHVARLSWIGCETYPQLDAERAALFHSKPDPFEIVAAAEQGDAGTAPARVVTCATFIRREFSLGSVSNGFCDGSQTSSLYVTAGSESSIGPVAYLRYLVDDEVPGRPGEVTWWHNVTQGPDECASRASMVAVQSGASALAICSPQTPPQGKPARSLRLAMVVPNHQNSVREVWTANGQMGQDAAGVSPRQWFGFMIGEAAVAFRPLIINVADTEATICVRIVEEYGYLRVECVNYEGREKVLDAKTASLLQNGMAVEVARAVDHPDIVAWLSELERGTAFEDCFLFNTRRLRYRRAALPDRPPVELAITRSAWSEASAIRLIDGMPAPEPILQATGRAARDMPFLDTPYRAPLGLLWEKLACFGVPDAPHAIAEGARTRDRTSV